MTTTRHGRRARTAALAIAVTAAMLALVACGSSFEPPVNEPQPDAPLGFVALNMADTAPPRFSLRAPDALPQRDVTPQDVAWVGPIADGDVTLAPTGASSVLMLDGTVYTSREFVLTNDTAAALDNLVLLAYGRDEFRAGSALSQPLIVADQPALDYLVRAVTPTHHLGYDASAPDADATLTGDPTRSDFVAFTEPELPTLGDHAFVTTVFPYGFAIRNAGDPTSRTVPAGGQGRVHVAFAYPAESLSGRNMASFTWNAVLLSMDHVRVTQATEENHSDGWAATLDRASAAEADVVVAIGPGSRDTPAALCESVLAVSNVRVAGTDASDPNHATLVPDDGTPEFTGCEGAP